MHKNRLFIISVDGYLCCTADEYSAAIMHIYQSGRSERQAMVKAARIDVERRFAGELFAQKFVKCVAQTI